MIHVVCRTNLDLHFSERWPKVLPCRPMPGDLICSLTVLDKPLPYKSPRFLQLEVGRITFVKKHPSTNSDEMELEVELGLPKGRYQSMNEFQEWYDRCKSGHYEREENQPVIVDVNDPVHGLEATLRKQLSPGVPEEDNESSGKE